MAKKTPTKISGSAQPAQEVKREVAHSPNFVSVYANDIQVQTSPWDMHLILGAIAKPATADDLVVTINQVAEVHISLQLAKRLVAIMAGQIQSYEERFGTIPSPDSGPE